MMTRAEKQNVLNAIESVDLDLKEMRIARRKAQEELDNINNSICDAFIRLQNLEAWVNNQHSNWKSA